MKKQVIEVNGIYYGLDQAFNGLQNILIKTNQLADHPDMTSMESADKLLVSLAKTTLLSEKAVAIVAYELALRNIYLYTEDED